MAAKIQIRDGNPWWVSPDIWVVPSSDPNGIPGSPIAGQQNYLWAKVHNIGTNPITGARINFYWSNPAMGVLRSNSTLVGFGFVDLDIGETKDVLCITPWVPIVVNGGHECVVAEAITSADPLPTPLPDAFDPPTFDQVAQLNLQVLIVSPLMRFSILPLQLSSPLRVSKNASIRIENVKLDKENEKALFKQIGLDKIPNFNEELVKFGLSQQGDCHASEEAIGNYNIDLKIAEGNSTAVFVHIEQHDSRKSGYQLINVMETVNEKIQGGNSILIIKN